MNRITETDINTLPNSLLNYENMKELAELAVMVLNDRARDINYTLIWSRIDELDEALLDVLAYDLHIDWYDYSYSIEQKRSVIKTSIAVHKKLGTRYAVETALKSAYPNSSIIPWFEEGGSGEPYTFDVILDTSESSTAVNMLHVGKIVKYYKSLRDSLGKTKEVNRQSVDVYAGCLLMERVRENVAPAADDTALVFDIGAYSGTVFRQRITENIRCNIIIPAVQIRVYDTYDEAIADEGNVPYHTVGVYIEE